MNKRENTRVNKKKNSRGKREERAKTHRGKQREGRHHTQKGFGLRCRCMSIDDVGRLPRVTFLATGAAQHLHMALFFAYKRPVKV